MAVVMDMVTEKIKALTKPAEKESTSGQTYTYVETDFIKALKTAMWSRFRSLPSLPSRVCWLA